MVGVVPVFGARPGGHVISVYRDRPVAVVNARNRRPLGDFGVEVDDLALQVFDAAGLGCSSEGERVLRGLVGDRIEAQVPLHPFAVDTHVRSLLTVTVAITG